MSRDIHKSAIALVFTPMEDGTLKTDIVMPTGEFEVDQDNIPVAIQTAMDIIEQAMFLTIQKGLQEKDEIINSKFSAV